jgi:hypothetical protein
MARSANCPISGGFIQRSNIKPAVKVVSCMERRIISNGINLCKLRGKSLLIRVWSWGSRWARAVPQTKALRRFYLQDLTFAQGLATLAYPPQAPPLLAHQ